MGGVKSLHPPDGVKWQRDQTNAWINTDSSNIIDLEQNVDQTNTWSFDVLVFQLQLELFDLVSELQRVSVEEEEVEEENQVRTERRFGWRT